MEPETATVERQQQQTTPTPSKSKINSTTSSAQSPVITPVSGAVCSQPCLVMIVTNTPAADIHYTLDGAMPTCDSPIYTSAIVVDTSGKLTVKAFATRSDLHASRVVESSFVITASLRSQALPARITPKSGAMCPQPSLLIIESDTPVAQIYYTLDGTMPTSSPNNKNSVLYTSPIVISAPGVHTVKAVVCRIDLSDSDMVESKFTINDGDPFHKSQGTQINPPLCCSYPPPPRTSQTPITTMEEYLHTIYCEANSFLPPATIMDDLPDPFASYF
jgi:hypothetical protein